jgi:type 1 glutamine amidotransferase
MFVKQTVILVAVCAVLSTGLCSAQAAEPVPAKIVLVYTLPDHAYGTHMYERECNLLAHCLKQTRGVETAVAKDWPDKTQLDHVRSLVFYSHPAGDIALTADHREPFNRLTKEGVGLVALHWATGAEKERGEEYSSLLGGWFNFAHAGLKVDTQLLEQQDPKHQICNGWKPYQLHDEFYLNMKFHDGINPVLKVKVDGKDQVVAWTYNRPNSNGGRSFATTLGHFHENFGLPDFRRAVVNGILWSAHVKVPENGAPVEVSDKELKLPPQK